MNTKLYCLRLICTAVVSLLVLHGCASAPRTQSSEKSSTQEAPSAPIPTDSPLAQITKGMSPDKVRDLIGSPDDSTGYPTGKQWIPFYYGPDTSRTDWLYQGQGRIVFSRNRYSGNLRVIRISYNPDELH